MQNEVGPSGRDILGGRHPSENDRIDDAQGPFQLERPWPCLSGTSQDPYVSYFLMYKMISEQNSDLQALFLLEQTVFLYLVFFEFSFKAGYRWELMHTCLGCLGAFSQLSICLPLRS